jgi:hypothetical protein
MAQVLITFTKAILTLVVRSTNLWMQDRTRIDIVAGLGLSFTADGQARDNAIYPSLELFSKNHRIGTNLTSSEAND